MTFVTITLIKFIYLIPPMSSQYYTDTCDYLLQFLGYIED